MIGQHKRPSFQNETRKYLSANDYVVDAKTGRGTGGLGTPSYIINNCKYISDFHYVFRRPHYYPTCSM